MTPIPLLTRTPDAWATEALADVPAFLGDHAHLERKAASNALALFQRFPDDLPDPIRWTRALSDIARDETRHLGQVLRLLAARGGILPRHHANPYAADLQATLRAGRGPDELVDRLLISALIEARSCERFEVLANACPDVELSQFFAGLLRSENGHFATFLRLARLVRPARSVAARWQELLEHEAAVIASQPRGSRVHSGPPPA